jgi:mono/diheme cytochrome c family protein
MNENQPQNFDSTDLDSLHTAVKREKPDVQPGREPAPLWVFVASMAAMIFGGGYAGAYVGNFDFQNNSAFAGKPVDPRPIEHGVDVQLDAFQLAMKKGPNVFNTCQGCHQVNGAGVPGTYPPLAGSDWVHGGTERIARVVIHGLVGPVTVKGGNYNFPGGMPPQGQLSDKELSYVLTYIRNSWGNQGSMVTPEMVAKVREASKGHVGQMTAADLEPFKDKNIEGEIPAGPGATVVPAAAPAAAPAPAK